MEQPDVGCGARADDLVRRPLTMRLALFARGGIGRSIGGVGTAAAISHLIGLAAAPLLARLYSEEAFGRFGIFFSVANILAVVALLGFSDAVIAARQDRTARALGAACAISIAVLTLPACLFAWFLIRSDALGLGGLPEWAALLLVPEIMLLCSLSLLQVMLVRARLYRPIGTSYLAMGIGKFGGQVGLGFGPAGLTGLALGELLGRGVMVGAMAAALRREIAEMFTLRRREIVDAVRAYRNFPLFRTPSALASAVAVGAPPLMVAAAYGVGEAGYFSLMFTIVMAPMTLIQKAVGDVFLGHFATRLRADRMEAKRLLLRFAAALAALGMVAAAGAAVLGPPLFPILLGENWRTAGLMAAAAWPWLLGVIAVMPISSALNATNRPELKIIFDVLYLGGLGASFVAAPALGLDSIGFVSLMSWTVLGACACYFALILYSCNHPRVSE